MKLICKQVCVSGRNSKISLRDVALNFCPACEAKRIEAWGKPTDSHIQQKAEGIRKLQTSNLAEYQQRIDDVRRRAYARDNND